MMVIDRFADWSEAICDLVMDVSASQPETVQSFRASISTRKLGAASMSHFRSGAHKIERNAQRIRRSYHDDYLISFQRCGQASVTCGDNRFVLNPGDAAVVDCAAPFALTFNGAVERQIARIPRTLFNAGTGIDRCNNGIHLYGETLMLRLLRHYFAEIGQEAGSHLSPDLTFDLCRLVKGAIDGADNVQSRQSGLWQRVRNLIDVRLTDPELSLPTAAEMLGVSARTIQREYAGRGTTFGSYVLRRRLQMAAAQFRDGRFADCSITAIALSWGFNDTAHFSRVFRKQYQMSPTRYRTKPNG